MLPSVMELTDKEFNREDALTLTREDREKLFEKMYTQPQALVGWQVRKAKHGTCNTLSRSLSLTASFCLFSPSSCLDCHFETILYMNHCSERSNCVYFCHESITFRFEILCYFI